METVTVNAVALRRVLEALNGPGHYIRELQATRARGELFADNPIDVLVDDFNRGVEAWNMKQAEAAAVPAKPPGPPVTGSLF
jgi:hypothetical protein